jgi:hypothetical protein
MLLTIDEEKIRECMESARKPEYVVTASHVSSVGRPDAPMPSFEVAGTAISLGSRLERRAKEHIVALRREIEESGVPLKTANELDSDIDEMKGRK